MVMRGNEVMRGKPCDKRSKDSHKVQQETPSNLRGLGCAEEGTGIIIILGLGLRVVQRGPSRQTRAEKGP